MQKSYRAPNPGDSRPWFIIDAKDKPLGRLAVVIANKQHVYRARAGDVDRAGLRDSQYRGIAVKRRLASRAADNVESKRHCARYDTGKERSNPPTTSRNMFPCNAHFVVSLDHFHCGNYTMPADSPQGTAQLEFHDFSPV